MKVLLVDNNDSFTYNIVDLCYKLAFENISVVRSAQLQPAYVEGFDKVILSPGPGLPEDFPILSRILDLYKAEKSILGICLGHQAICAHFGARLFNLPSVIHGQQHRLHVLKPGGLFLDVPTEFGVGLYHSWAVDINSLPEELEVSAVARNQLLMAVSHRRYDIHGVQFHPESFVSEFGSRILRNFLQKAGVNSGY